MDIKGLKRAGNFKGIKIISLPDVTSMQEDALNSFNFRAPILINDSFDDSPQRFVNCLTPFTYVRPHKHRLPNQWELMCWLHGKVTALFFDEAGILMQKVNMSNADVRVLEIPTDCYHTFIAEEYSAYLEVRNCNYQPEIDRVYADWAPAEDHPYFRLYLKQLINTPIGGDATFNLDNFLGSQDAS